MLDSFLLIVTPEMTSLQTYFILISPNITLQVIFTNLFVLSRLDYEMGVTCRQVLFTLLNHVRSNWSVEFGWVCVAQFLVINTAFCRLV